MAARPLLVVMIVRDAGFRSALAARLSHAFDLLTTTHWSDTLPRRGLARRPAVLVIDEESAAGEAGGWIRAQAEGLFARVIVLTVDPPTSADPLDDTVRVGMAQALDEIIQLVGD